MCIRDKCTQNAHKLQLRTYSFSNISQILIWACKSASRFSLQNNDCLCITKCKRQRRYDRRVQSCSQDQDLWSEIVQLFAEQWQEKILERGGEKKYKKVFAIIAAGGGGRRRGSVVPIRPVDPVTIDHVTQHLHDGIWRIVLRKIISYICENT